MPRQKKNNPLPLIFIALGGFLLLVAVIVLARQQSSASAPTPTASQPENVAYPDIQRITLAEAKAAYDQGQAVFVDVRGPVVYEAAHIPGALLIPANEFETRWNELNPDDWIITYCT